MSSPVNVVATTAEGTLAALKVAVPLAKGSGARLAVLVPHIVSTASALDVRPESLEPAARRYAALARTLGGEAVCECCVCIGVEALIERLCSGQATLVVGGPVGRWLMSPEERFASRLTRAGCEVLFVGSGVNRTQRRVTAA